MRVAVVINTFLFVHFAGLGSSIRTFTQSLRSSAPIKRAVITSLQLILNYFCG